ncbi:hypothetical protein EDB85DRAFT_1938353 [Lactarius pseudohatsudake]|nr:hypothetical protein EDB85DRAFT_1938353 [Lactarius pseudohatsudake]
MTGTLADCLSLLGIRICTSFGTTPMTKLRMCSCMYSSLQCPPTMVPWPALSHIVLICLSIIESSNCNDTDSESNRGVELVHEGPLREDQ